MAANDTFPATSSTGDSVTLNGPKADCDIYMICDAGATAEVGYSLAP